MSTRKLSQSKVVLLAPKLAHSENRAILPKKVSRLAQKLAQKESKNHILFTDLSIKHLANQEHRIIFWCIGKPDFGIRVSPNGNKTWIYKYRYEKKTKRLSLGKYPKVKLREATQLYLAASNKVFENIDPLAEKATKQEKYQQTPSLIELIEMYLNHCKNSGKVSWEAEKRCFNVEFSSSFKENKITDIDEKVLAAIFYAIISRGSPSTASHLYSYTRRLFNFASDMGFMKYRDNPCSEIKLKIPKRNKQRHLNTSELYLFWNNLESIPTSEIIKLALRFQLLTVSRSIDVRRAKWSDIDINKGIWTLPITKNGQMHRVYLGNLALDVLQEVKKHTHQKTYVFGSPRDLMKKNRNDKDWQMLERNSMSQPLVKNFKKLGITEKFTPHDLRRTGATIIAGLFGRRDFASLALNHTKNDATAIYDQYVYDREKKMILDALNRAVEFIVSRPNIESVPSFEDLRNKIID